jgi:subtilisin family serine protease
MTGRQVFLRILIVAVLLLGTTGQASAAVPVIVQLGPLSSVTSIVSTLGGTVLDSIPGTNIYLLNLPFLPSSLTASLLGIQWLEVNQGVALPALPMPVPLKVPSTVPADWYKYQPSMLLIHSRDALAYSKGRGVMVADLNSRVDVGHPALIGHLTTGYDFVSTKPDGSTALNQSSSSFMDQSSSSFMDQSSSSFMDQFGISFLNQSSSSFMDGNPAYSHGTLCAGVIAVVAPESMIMPLRVFDDQGSADLFTIAKAIRYAVNNGAQVVNMSFGTLQNSQAIKSSINFALSKNVVLVASAGNNNTSAVQYPAAYSGVITTAATDLFDKKASFSNYGSYVYVDAPGVNIFSSYPQGDYSMVSGTSFSAPIVAGTAALIRSMQATGIGNDIATGSINIDAKNPKYINQLGYGRIDVLQAVKAH